MSAHGAALDGRVVVIDPGHNPGNAAHAHRIAREVDAGMLRKACDTVGAQTAEGYPEWGHNLRVARRLARILRNRGAFVVLTHDGRRPVWGPCITTQARITNRRRADVAISIHVDGNTGPGRGLHRRSDIGGLNLSDVPKVLIETGNLRNATDATLLTASDFQWREARGLADGLTAFLTRSSRLVE